MRHDGTITMPQNRVKNLSLFLPTSRKMELHQRIAGIIQGRQPTCSQLLTYIIASHNLHSKVQF